MHIAKTVLAMAGIALMLFAVGCAGGDVEPAPDADATIEARVQASAEAASAIEATEETRVEQELKVQVASTPQPSPTPYPTNTLYSSPTSLPSPTPTAKPTATNTPPSLITPLLEPTDTPVPTDTPLLKPTDAAEPTFTPAPSPMEMMWNRRVEEAFTPSDCPPATKLELEDSDYKGPLIDTHFHMSNLWDAPLTADGDGDSYEREVLRGDFPMDLPILGKNITMTEIACRLEREGTDRVYAFFPVESDRPGQLRPSLEVVRRTMELYPTRFVPFIQPLCCNETVPTVDASTLSEYLEIYPGLFQGHGEIVLYDQLRSGGGRKAEDYPPEAPLLLDVYRVLRQHKLLVWLHPGEGHQDSLERVLKQHADLNFIVHGEETESNISNLMEKYSNIYFAVNDLHGKEYPLRIGGSKSRFLAILGDYEPLIEKDLATWQELIEAYPDRFMWATDRGSRAGLWSYDADVGHILVDYARAFIGRLDPAVQERFAYKNAQRILQD